VQIARNQTQSARFRVATTGRSVDAARRLQVIEGLARVGDGSALDLIRDLVLAASLA
jgi:hypothetical protein